MALQVGDKFPDFTAPDQDGQQVDLSEYQNGKKMVVFFYPKATTPGCVRETTEFGARRHEFDAVDTQIVGVSVDDVELQKQHAVQCAANFPTLCDTDKSLTTQLGLLNEERGTAKRTTFILDGSGTVRRVFEGVTVDGHVDEVLSAVKEV
jgi:peroxiredoxin Q/BCP